MRHRYLTMALLAVVLATAGPIATTESSARPLAQSAKKAAAVPQGFVGMNIDGPLLNDPVNLPQQFHKMVSAGVESIRVAFSWAAAQPVKDGPINFATTDAIVGDAAQRDLSVLPVVLYAPDWDAAPHPPNTFPRPARTAPYAAYARALVLRYGPRGSYWSQHRNVPRRPIRMWQIWNEPNFYSLWPTTPFAPTYVKLVHAAHAAIKRADPGAKVVLAGLPNLSWKSLAQIYAVRGAGKDFDVVAVHPYTTQPSGVITILQLVRAVMAHHGDAGKPLLATETGWNSSIGRQPSDNYCCQTTRAGQVRDVNAVLPLLASHRQRLHLLGFYFYTWATQESTGAPSFNFAGLFDYTAGGRFLQKPAFNAFSRGALALERCRRKGATATRCSRSG
jgi:hypothetical protein